MPIVWFMLLLFSAGLVFYVIPAARSAARRRRATEQPFPETWKKILQENLPPYRKLSEAHRRQLHRCIQLFIAEKAYEGCGGVVIDDEVRVTVAAQACMLLLKGGDACYPRLRSVVIYPSTYVARGGSDEQQARLGESWGLGTVVLAWDSVRHGAVNFDDGHNVTLHEFAHQLDQADGSADGAPELEPRAAYASWARIFSREFEALQKRTRRGKRSVMDRYGATNPAEFFAVATETFYEKPKQLKNKHPELFEELKRFYQVNPLDWVV